jgi:acetyl esterase/lipase
VSKPNLIPTIPKGLFDIFEGRYLGSKPDMTSPLLRPGIAPDELLREAIPNGLVIITCGGDELLAESETFR